MSFNAEILRDSVSPLGVRLTTLLVRIPRFILAEVNTHRMLSRSSASSRAIPVERQLRAVMEEPFVPERFGINEGGMQSSQFLTGEQHDLARRTFLRGRDRAVITALELLYGTQLIRKFFPLGLEGVTIIEFDEKLKSLKGILVKSPNPDILNVHKQFANRVIEPYSWHTVVITATDLDNFFALRDHENAQPEIKMMARLMKTAMTASTPRELQFGQWHMPFVRDEEMEEAFADPKTWKLISAGRSARVSYETHLGVRDLKKDIELANTLRENGHMSPFEHVATPGLDNSHIGNFRGWIQLRKQLPGESDYSELLKLQAA